MSYAELWVEKEALAGVLEPIAEEYHVTLMVNKGYSSASAMYASARRLLYHGSRKERVTVFYLGDLDPSGEDMVRDIEDRLGLFTRDALPLKVIKLALTSDQVTTYSPPPNPTKLTDSRAQDYIDKFGHECWEVDALEPKVLRQVISDEFDAILDRPTMDDIVRQEEDAKDALTRFLEDEDF
jgi:hypothetical protein